MKFGEPMRDHTSLRIGGPADIFVLPRDLESLFKIHTHLRTNLTPFLACGGGTNILVRDGGIEGAVFCLRSLRKIGPGREDGENIYLETEAGASLWTLVNFARERGWSGLEGLAGIPGTVGGAICGNAGAFGYEMKDVLVSVQLLDATGRIKRVPAEEIGFGYRTSGVLEEDLLLSAQLRLGKGKQEVVSDRTENFLKIKREKQPVRERSAGCVFKNPPGLSAGRLIDEAGCKGMRAGDVEVSPLHANFFVNKGNARASDFIMLMENVSRRVEDRFRVELEPEIKIVGRDRVN